MTATNPMTGEQLDELMTVAVNMQRDSEKAGDRPAAMFAYAVQVAVLELRKVRDDAAKIPETSMSITRYWISPNGIACEDVSGSFVKYDEYTVLEQKLAESQREFRAADATIENLQMQVEKLAAENAGLKAATIFLADEASQVYKRWNLIQQPDGDIVDMQTIHEAVCACHETPATDAFLAEVRARAIDSLVDIKTKQLADMHPDTHAFGATAMTICSQINELQMFAAQLRKGVQS